MRFFLFWRKFPPTWLYLAVHKAPTWLLIFMLFHFYDFSPGHVCSNYTFIWQTRVHTTLHTYLVVQFSDSVAVQWCCLLEVPRDQQIKFIHTVSNSEFHECYSFHNFSLRPIVWTHRWQSWVSFSFEVCLGTVSHRPLGVPRSSLTES